MSNDVSGTIAVGGTAQQLIAARDSASGYCVQNLDASVDLWVNDEGGAATAAPGSIKIPAGAMYETPQAWATQPRHDAVSIFSTKTGHAFTARRW